MAYALLIDDDAGILKSAKALVEGEGLELETASTWDEGIAKFHAHFPELVICDYNLPGTEMGLALLRDVAKLSPSVRLVLVSAYLTENDVEQLQAVNAVDLVARKLNAVQTATLIRDEVRSASERHGAPTDWGEVAKRHARTEGVDDNALERLDLVFKASRI